MIQRIQSVYLLIVFLLMVVLFFSPVPENIKADLWRLFCALIGVAALGIIFLYKKRKIQMTVSRYLAALLLGVFLARSISTIGKFEFSISSLLFFIPLVAAGFAFAAHFAIKKDEKLIRSLDRLR